MADKKQVKRFALRYPTEAQDPPYPVSLTYFLAGDIPAGGEEVDIYVDSEPAVSVHVEEDGRFTFETEMTEAGARSIMVRKASSGELVDNLTFTLKKLKPDKEKSKEAERAIYVRADLDPRGGGQYHVIFNAYPKKDDKGNFDGVPVEGAVVQVAGQELPTDKNGEAEIDLAVPTGKWRHAVHYSVKGYTNKESRGVLRLFA